MESLLKQVLKANEQHKIALDQYTRRLRAELDAVDQLIAAVQNLSDDNLQEDPGDKWCLHADGALKPNSIIDRPQLFNERSPFFAEAVHRERYSKCLIPNPFNVSEKRYLEKAIMKENKRLAALWAQAKGEDAFKAVSHLDHESFLDNVEGISWEYVARDVSTSNNPARTAQECKVRWLGYQHPKFKFQRWSVDEETSLHDLVESKRESGQLDWEGISTLLETNRTALECIKKFQASTRPTFRWTNALDNKLREEVDKYGIGNWVLVASSVSPHLSANQCQIRYERSLKPEIKRGRFTAMEDELLTKAIEVHGTDWVKVAQAVPGRTNAQCRGRYALILSSKETWDAEEDEKLRAAISRHGHQWDKVREEMGAIRSQTQYSSRYRILKRLDAQDKECPDVPGPSLASYQSERSRIETSTSQAYANQVVTESAGSETSASLPNMTDANPETQGEERSDSTKAPVAMANELNTTQKKTGTNRGRKRKAPPSVAERDGQMSGGLNTTQQPIGAKRGSNRTVLPSVAERQTDGSRPKRPEPKPTSAVVFPSDSGANIDADPIFQSTKKGHVGDSAPMEGNMETSPSEPGRRASVAADLSDLTDLELVSPIKRKVKRAQPAANRKAGQPSHTTLESTSTHSTITRASKRRKVA